MPSRLLSDGSMSCSSHHRIELNLFPVGFWLSATVVSQQNETVWYIYDIEVQLHALVELRGSLDVLSSSKVTHFSQATCH